MNNPFRAVLSAFGWTTSPSHENYDWIFLLLNYAADEFDAHGESVTYSDPAREVLHRFAAYPGPAYVALQQLLNARIK